MKKIIKVEGMSCMHCKNKVEKTLKAIKGVNDAVVNLKSKDVTVDLNDDVLDETLTKAISDVGYEVIEVKIKKGLFR